MILGGGDVRVKLTQAIAYVRGESSVLCSRSVRLSKILHVELVRRLGTNLVCERLQLLLATGACLRGSSGVHSCFVHWFMVKQGC